MKGVEWLDALAQRVNAQLADIETFRADPKTLSLARGNRVVTAFDTGDVGLISPSFSAGGSIGSRLQERVQHVDPTTFNIAPETVHVAADAVISHLR